jgi:hypothetical protein
LLVVVSVAVIPTLALTGPAAAAKGGNKAKVAGCKQSVLTGTAFSNQGQCVSSAAKGSAPATLEFVTPGRTYSCSQASSCWGIIQWSGLSVGSQIEVVDSDSNAIEFISVESASMTDQRLNIPCGSDTIGVVAFVVGRTSIRSQTVDTPCG